MILKNKLPLVSIIIVNFNGKQYLEKCLESLMKINYNDYEIIILDNNSTDDSISFVEQKYPQIIVEKLDQNYGFAHPNNLGAKMAKGDFLLFLNNDTIVTPDFLSELITTITSNSNIAICQSFLLKMNGDVDSSGDFIDTLGRAFSSREKNPNFKNIFSARAACMITRKEIFFRLGGFDEKFFVSFEDVDLGWRANIFGYDVVLSSKSVVYHFGGQTIKKINKLIQFHSVKNSIILRLTNFELLYSFRSILTLFFVIFMRRFFKIKVIDDPEISPPLPSLKIMISGSFWIVKNLGYVLKKRKKIQMHRVNSTQKLIELKLIKN
ncbi:glycosyltransferase family 2 protein [Nitrosopumilus sp. S4]